MSGTRLYAGEALRDGQYVHVMGYQNNASNLSLGPNAMILPIPAASKLGPENAIDTRKFKGFLSDIAEATKTPTFSRGRSKGSPAEFDSLGTAEVFDVGSYTVVLAERPGQVREALGWVPTYKRPTINNQVLASYNKNYPGWQLAVCCWDGSVEAEPLLWWYEPKAPEILFAPALDAHNGEAPSKKDVLVDHIVTFGSTLKPTGMMPVRYSDAIPAPVAEMLPTRAVGQKILGMMPNGDFWYPTKNFVGTLDLTPPLPGRRFWPGMATEKSLVHLGRWT